MTGALLAAPAADEAPLLFPGPAGPIALHGAEHLAAELEDLISLWAPLDRAGPPCHAIGVRRDAAGWHLDCPVYDFSRKVFADAYAAANEVITCLIGCCLAQDRRLLCLHAAAVACQEGLIVLLGTNHAGKSTMSIALAALGHRFFSDDQLIVDHNGPRPEGLALGVAPKLRLPLPDSAPPGFRAFFEARMDVAWSRVAVLYLDPEAAACHGARRRIAALIDLRRDPDAGAPALQPSSRADMVKLLLNQVMAPRLLADALLRTAADHVRETPCYRLDYADTFAAARLLSRHFAPEPKP